MRRLVGGNGVEPQTFTVGLPEQHDYPYAGVVNFLDNTVDPWTGTIYVRGELPNASGQLLPGMFVQVRLPIAERKGAVLIPEKAVSTDLGGKYLLVVGEENVLRRQDVTLGAVVDGLRVVLDGLNGDETFIVGGFHMARPGMPIQPMPEGQMPSGMPGAPGETGTTDFTENTD